MTTDSTPSALVVPTVQRPFTATIAPPGSKSLTNRGLVLAALAQGSCTLSNVLLADDTLVMLQGLRELGFELAVDAAAKTATVHGTAGVIPADAADLFCGNSGTTIRFLAALCALGHGTYALDGIPRMRQRPIRDLVKLLRDVGATVQHLGEDGFPPLRVSASGLAGGMLAYESVLSSQYLSALLMVSPFARDEVHVNLAANQTSWPYVAMTMRLMDTFGVTPELVRTDTGEPQQIVIPPGVYAATNYAVEPDASNAAYFLAAAAVHPGASVTIDGLGSTSLQGDVGVADVLRQMGATVEVLPHSIRLSGPATLRGIDTDLRGMPDQAQTLAVVALFAAGTTTLRGLHTLRVKETDRLAALVAELSKFGAAVTVENDDTLHITPPSKLRGDVSIATYDDHRMAMSFAVAGTRVARVAIENPACVNKTYPDFFADLQRVLGRSMSVGQSQAILLLRHGETDANAAGHLQGHLPTPLNLHGVRQATLLAGRLASHRPAIDVLVCSDLPRAQQTAAPIAAACGLTPQLDRAWRERFFGPLEGKPIGDRELWRVASGEFDPPGAELTVAMHRRISGALASLPKQHPRARCIAVVTHGGPIRSILRMLVERRLCRTRGPLPEELAGTLPVILNCSILHLLARHYRDGVRWRVVHVNDVGHLGPTHTQPR